MPIGRGHDTNMSVVLVVLSTRGNRWLTKKESKQQQELEFVRCPLVVLLFVPHGKRSVVYPFGHSDASMAVILSHHYEYHLYSY